MCVPDSRRTVVRTAAPALGLAAWLVGALALQTAAAQAPPPAAPAVKQARPGSGPAPPPQSVDGRYGIVVLAPKVDVHAEPATRSPVIVELEQGLRLDADRRRGNWYHVSLPEGRSGWINYVVRKTAADFSVDASPGIARARPGGESGTASAGEAPPAVAAPEPLPDDEVVLKIPGAKPLEAPIPTIEPYQVPAPSPLVPRETIPVPDRWRLTDELGLIHQHWYDPYNPNTLKGDRPIFGNDWFFPVTLVSDTLFEARKLPTSVGAQSSQNEQENNQFGNGRQSTFTENLIASFSLLKGDTTFKPPELEFRLVPVFNYNVSEAQEVRVLNIDPRQGTTRYDHFAAIQEGFVDYEYHIASERYDFDDIRVGIQPFISDFRGFLFQDEPVGVRFFGTRDNNQWQYNLAGFQRLEKDTNSGLNDVGRPLRKDYLFVANLYKQDFYVRGFTLQGTVIYNDNRETATFLNTNGFQVRPAVFGDARPHPYHVTYLGLNGDGHFGPWNTTASLYYANGRDTASQFSGKPADISAFYGVAEVSRDFDWIRVRGSALYATGDSNPHGGRETGFDAILENPQIRRRRYELLDPPGGAAYRRRRRRAVGAQRRARRSARIGGPGPVELHQPGRDADRRRRRPRPDCRAGD